MSELEVDPVCLAGPWPSVLVVVTGCQTSRDGYRELRFRESRPFVWRREGDLGGDRRVLPDVARPDW